MRELIKLSWKHLLGLAVSLVLAGVVVLFLTGRWGQASTAQTLYFNGRITQTKVDRFKYVLQPGDTLVFRSLGGKVNAAVDLADFIHENGIKVRIRDVCVSACAEIILISTPDVTLEHGTLVGFHGNSQMKQHLYAENDRFGVPDCFKNNADAILRIYSRTDSDHEFWKQQMEVLRPIGVTIADGVRECGILRYDMRASVWYPDQATIEDFLGRRLATALCNDSEACVVSKIKRRRSKGRWYIIGTDRQFH